MADQQSPLNFSLRHLTAANSPADASVKADDLDKRVGSPAMGKAVAEEEEAGSEEGNAVCASPDHRSSSAGSADTPHDPQLSAALSAMFGAGSPFGQGHGVRIPGPAQYSALFGSSMPFFNQASYMQSIAAMSAAVNAAMYGQKNNSSVNDGTTVSVNSFNLSNSPRSRSPTPVSGSAQLSCAVCGDVSSGKHYGILACNGCSGFFKRSVRRRLIYRCQAGTGQCVVDKAHRNQCQACRLKKCLAKGMNKDAVQNERQPRNTATVQNPSDADLYHASFLRDCSTVLSSTVDFQNLGLELAGLGRKSSLEAEMKELGAHSNPEVSSRLLFMGVKWAKALPSFAQLSQADQTSLLESTWAELFVLCAFQWSLEMEKCPLFHGNEQSDLLRPLTQLFDLFKQRSPDQAELACLKALVLFRPECAGLRNPSQVERLQEQAQLMLQQHTQRDAQRLGRLLLLLPALRQASLPRLVEVVFLESALGGKSVTAAIHEICKA